MNDVVIEEQTTAGHPLYADQTTIHPAGIAIVILLGIGVLLLPRRWSVMCMVIMACFVPAAQRIVIFTLDFNFLRILVLFGIVRILLGREYSRLRLNRIDGLIVLWTFSSVFFFTLRQFEAAAFINRLGFSFDVLGMYFLFRCFIQSWEEFDWIIKGFAVVSIPVAGAFILEYLTARNIFAVFGGVPFVTDIRQERLRCQGAYSHPILAGCFWASLLPLFAALWWKSLSERVLAVTGIAMSLIIIFTCASSTPVMGVAAAIGGGMMFLLRGYMIPVFWGSVFMLTALHLVMKAPVWHLIARVSAVGGSTGWHRYFLIDQTIRNFGDWWLWGCSAETVLSWEIHAADVTNQYVLEGINGGILSMLFFIMVLAAAFLETGKLRRINRNSRYHEVLSWALGVSLFIHSLNFIGVAYFGQIWMIWFLLLGTIASLSSRCPDVIPAARIHRVKKTGTYHVHTGNF